MDADDIEAQRVAGAQRCLCGSPEDQCPNPAVVHVLQVDGYPTMSCPTHSVWWTRAPLLDMHPIGGACGLPGMTWTGSGNGSIGHCSLEDS